MEDHGAHPKRPQPSPHQQPRLVVEGEGVAAGDTAAGIRRGDPDQAQPSVRGVSHQLVGDGGGAGGGDRHPQGRLLRDGLGGRYPPGNLQVGGEQQPKPHCQPQQAHHPPRRPAKGQP